MNALPNSATVEVLTSIWQSVLHRSPIGLNDDFFDLGGNRALAKKLSAEVDAACGVALRPTAICEAPTIAALAALVDRPASATPAPLVLLKPGPGNAPVFLTHGIGGSVIDLVPMARLIDVKAPIYGMEAKGNDGMEAPFERIEDMAQFYLEAVRRLQPAGPYFFIGYSLGGLVALEMARAMVARKERVAFFAMLDTYPHHSHLTPGQRARLSLRKLGHRASSALHPARRETVSKIAPPNHGRSPTSISAAETAIRALESAELAWSRYIPQPYIGTVHFIRAETVMYFPEDAAAVWARYLHEFEVDTVPGDHTGIVTTFADKMAALLSRHLADAFRREQSSSGTPIPIPRTQRNA